MAGQSVRWCVNFDCFTSSLCISCKVQPSLRRYFGGFIQWKKSSDDELSSNTSTSCDVELLQLVVEGEGSFNSIAQALSSRVVEEGDVTEEDEDDGDSIRFAT